MSERASAGFPSYLLGGHVADGAHDETGFGSRLHGGRVGAVLRGFRARELREPEVQNLGPAVIREEQIFGLEVAVDYAFFVSSSKASSDLQGIVDCLAAGERAASQPVAKRFAFEEFRDNVGGTLLVVTDVKDRENAGMIESGGGAGFLGEALQAIAVGGKRCRKDFDGYSTVEARIVGAIHFAHSACTDRRLNFVGPELRARGQCHVGGDYTCVGVLSNPSTSF